MTGKRPLSGGGWRIFIIVFAIALVALGARLVTTGVSIDTDIQTILPQTSGEVADIAAIRQAGAAVASRIVIGVTGGDASARRLGAQVLEDQLKATGIFSPAARDLTETIAWTRANRFEITCSRPPQELSAEWGAALAQKARIALFSGMVPLSGADLQADPFLLDFHQLSCLASSANASTEAQVAGRLSASPYELSVQDTVSGVIAEWRDDERFANLTLLRSGAVFFAEAAGAQAKSEITFVGGVSVLLILVLYIVSFRSVATAGLALTTVAAGALGGAWVCFVVFGTVHFSVFVFGSALTGVSADYAVHSFAARRAHHNTPPKLHRALTISMLTSGAGFGALLIFEIALFKQIGVFAIGGLAAAWLFAMTILPRLDRLPTKPSGQNAFLLNRFKDIRTLGQRPIVGLIAMAVVAGLFVGAASKITFVDDLKRFQTLSPELAAEQQALFPEANARFSTRFLLSSGTDLEDALRTEERALASLGVAADRFISLSRFDPSKATRALTRKAYQTHLYEPHLAALQGELGLPATSQSPLPNTEAPRPQWLNALQFERAGKTYLLAPMLETDPDEREITAPKGARIISPAAIYGGALAQYRASALNVFAVAAAFAAVFLLLINRQARAVTLVIPPLMGCALALALPALLGIPITLFSVLALFIVLGAGIDFSVFQWEMSDDDTGWTGAAVVIAALSTCAAMGMLGFSATLPVQTFGITIAVGVLGAMVFSFMIPRSLADKAQGGDDARNL